MEKEYDLIKTPYAPDYPNWLKDAESKKEKEEKEMEYLRHHPCGMTSKIWNKYYKKHTSYIR